jgi:hypothetical protein
MGERVEGGCLGEPRPRAARVLVGVLGAVLVFNAWLFADRQQGSQRLRVHRAVDLESRAARGPAGVRYRHGTYYRLARDLDGVTLHMDRKMAGLHGWALEGLGAIRVQVSRRSVLQTAYKRARALAAGATYHTRLEGSALHVLLDPAAREYVMSWVRRGRGTQVLVLPVDRYRAAGGLL